MKITWLESTWDIKSMRNITKACFKVKLNKNFMPFIWGSNEELSKRRQASLKHFSELHISRSRAPRLALLAELRKICSWHNEKPWLLIRVLVSMSSVLLSLLEDGMLCNCAKSAKKCKTTFVPGVCSCYVHNQFNKEPVKSSRLFLLKILCLFNGTA